MPDPAVPRPCRPAGSLNILLLGAGASSVAFAASSLRQDGHQVTEVQGLQGLRQAQQDRRHHVCVIDLALPGEAEFELVQDIRRADAQVGILMLLVARISEAGVKAFRAGADNYLLKPCSTPEFLACVNALSRWVI